MTPEIVLSQLLELSGTAGSVFSLVKQTYSTVTDRRLRLFLKDLAKELGPDTQAPLNKISDSPALQNALTSIVQRVLQTEGGLVIRITALITARVLNAGLANYDEQILLRGIGSLVDGEVILAKQLVDLLRSANLPLGTVNEVLARVNEKLLQPSPGLLEMFGESYSSKIEALKKAGVFEDTGHGLMGVSGGWGHAKVVSRSYLFAELATKAIAAEGLNV